MKLVLSVLLLAVAPNVFTECGKPTTPPPPPPPVITPDPVMLPICEQDPPYACWAICLAESMPGFTDQCLTGNGALEVEFEALVEEKLAEAAAQSVDVCPPGQLFMNITPCDVGITPVVDTTSEACRPAPPACGL
jgi:hypothetical protein